MENPNDHRICFVGDSFVQGTGDPLCLGWTGRLAVQAQRMGFAMTYYNLGVRRDTSRDILARWENECAVRLPSETQNYVAFSFGINDSSIDNYTRRISITESEENFQTIIEQSRSRYHTIVIGPAPVGDPAHNTRIELLSEKFEALAQKIEVPYLSVWEQLSTDSSWMKEVGMHDGYHPGDLGYSKLAETIGAWNNWWFAGQDTLSS